MDYEMTNTRNRGVVTANSLNILKGKLNTILPEEYRENPRKIYIVLGQDNLTSFSKGTWKRTENLKKYPFIILKRGNNNSLAINESKNVVLHTDFSNDASSSVVRKLFQEGNIEEAKRHIHPKVFESLENNNPYINPDCDKKGGYKFKTRKVRNKKLN
jgi:nicotinic acid mononucleotide adenylyltransferase